MVPTMTVKLRMLSNETKAIPATRTCIISREFSVVLNRVTTADLNSDPADLTQM